MTLTGRLAAAALMVAASAGAWNLAPCSASYLARRAKYANALRHAAPADRDYVPKPFPANDAEVREDFLHQLADRKWRSRLETQQIVTTVIPIENWSGRRCLGPRDGDRMYLLRFFDARTHTEVARATLQDSGLLDVTTYREADVDPAWWTIPIDAPVDVAKRVAALTGRQLVDAQYVTTYGTFECDSLLPCVAMRAPATKTTYIADPRGHVVALSPNAKRFSRARDLPRVEDIDRVKRTLAPGQKLMSLGGDAYAVVETVK